MRLKDYVKNKAHPEGSIAEGYIAEECLTFCSRYLQGLETVFNRPQRHNDIVDNIEQYKFSSSGRVIGKVESDILDQKSLAQAHRYVLLHSDIISEYRRFVYLYMIILDIKHNVLKYIFTYDAVNF